MRRAISKLLPLAAAFLAPIAAQAATSVWQNITVTRSSPGSARIAFTADNAVSSANRPADVITAIAADTTVQGVQSAPMRAVVWNTGDVPVTIGSVSFAGPNAGDFALNSVDSNCANAILQPAPTSYCRIWFNFTPSTTGAESATLSVSVVGGGTATLPVTGPGSSGSVVNIACGGKIPGTLSPNTTYVFAGSYGSPCTFRGVTLRPSNGTTVQGDCKSPVGANTIFDGGNGSSAGPFTKFTASYPNSGSPTGVTLRCITVQNYGGSKTCTKVSQPWVGCQFLNNRGVYENDNPELYTWDGWVVEHCTITGSGGYGVQLDGSAIVRFSRVNGNYGGGINPHGGLSGSNGATAIVLGNEIGNNNLAGYDWTFSTAGVKAVGDDSTPLLVLDNYCHDTGGNANCLWFDIHAGELTIEGNTIVNGGRGIMCEISGRKSSNSIRDNVILNAGNAFAAYWNECTNIDFEFNFLRVPPGQRGVVSEATCRGDANGNWNANYTLKNNTIVYSEAGNASNDYHGLILDNGARSCSSTSTWVQDFNTVYTPAAASDPHFTGTSLGGASSGWHGSSLATMHASYGVETHSTVTIGKGPTVNGCTGDGKYGIGCAGSGF
jgi:hypothetical protein